MIDVQALGHRYGPGPRLLREVGSSAKKGETIAILGPNGRGKTTHLKPLEGHAEVVGPLGYMRQMSQGAFPFTVLDMVLMGRAPWAFALESEFAGTLTY